MYTHKLLNFTCSYFRYSLLEIKNTENHVLRCNEGDGSVMGVYLY